MEAAVDFSILDDSLGIDWRIPTEHANLSEKDRKHEVLKDFESPFEYQKKLTLISQISRMERTCDVRWFCYRQLYLPEDGGEDGRILFLFGLLLIITPFSYQYSSFALQVVNSTDTPYGKLSKCVEYLINVTKIV